MRIARLLLSPAFPLVDAAPIPLRHRLQRAGAGIGIVCDEDSVVVDMVPGGAADSQRQMETKESPRLQIGDRIVCVDGEALDGRPLEEVISAQSPDPGLISAVISATSRPRLALASPSPRPHLGRSSASSWPHLGPSRPNPDPKPIPAPTPYSYPYA